MQTGQVFVSHTSDLARSPADRSFVQAVLDAVVRAGMAPVDMRYFAARKGQPADYCQQRVRDCDIYLAVVGFRYGSLVPGEMVSYTELEFIEAGVAGLPRLVFLLDETADLPADLVDVDRVAIDQFRQRLREAGLIVASFATVDGLELAVFQALNELAGANARVVPRQLPAAVAHFAGRSGELATLTGLLRGRAEVGGTVVISAVSGTAGVGKTALAVYWAHQVADRFPDGQLYVNLRGFDPAGSVMDSAEAIRRFLDALGVPPERIPADLDAQAALYRSQLAGRRMLVVLDNARDTAQVRPLLPGAPTCLVLVTSRNQLTSLIAADGAHPVALDLLSAAEAWELLARRIGADRVAAEPQAVAEIIARCAWLPLALAIVAARAAVRPQAALHLLADELRDTQHRWQTLTGDDPTTDVRTVFSWSYHALTPDAARLFRLLGLHPGPDLAAPAAASLTAIPIDRVWPLLAELTQASLVAEHIPGRYTFHDLLRAYATYLTHTTDPDEQRHAANHRVLDYYLSSAYNADRLLNPHRDPITLIPLQPGVATERPAYFDQALDWFTTEHRALLAAVQHAADSGWDTHTWQLAWTLVNYLDRGGHWQDHVAIQRAAVAATRRLSDPSVEARAHRLLAVVYLRLGSYDKAHHHFQQALDLSILAADQTGQAHIHINLAQTWARQRHEVKALAHARQALELYQIAGHERGQAIALNAVGWQHAKLGDHQLAVMNCEQALGLFQKLDDRDGQAATWDSLGYVHHHLGHHTQATTCYQHAVDLYRDLGDRYEEATALTNLGDTHHAAGNPHAARDAWQQALTILIDLDHPDVDDVRAKLHDLDQTTPDGE